MLAFLVVVVLKKVVVVLVLEEVVFALDDVVVLDEHRCIQRRDGGGGGVPPHCTPLKDFEKLDHKNAIKHKNRGPPPRFSYNPKYPPQRKLKMTVQLC
jgi:hypothetical protein